MLYSVILAGGSGKRFWPLSTEENPKQFLSIAGNKPLMLQTKERVLELSPPEQIRVVTTNHLAERIKTLGFDKGNLLIEPEGKNTLYAIALAAAKLLTLDKNALMLILPSDHWISNKRKFISRIKKGIEWGNKGYLVTYGIVPTRPETGYGYIERGKVIDENVLKVKRFTEKPNIKTATCYFKSDNFLWNSGIFLWKAASILEEIKEHQPHLAEVIARLQKNPSKKNIQQFYQTGAPLSIDYGVLERSENVLVIVSNFKWDDIGTWNSLERIFIKNDDDNIEKGKIHSLNSHNNIFYAENGIIVAKGLEDMIVVHTENATLIIPKNDAQEVKEIVDRLPKEFT